MKPSPLVEFDKVSLTLPAITGPVHILKDINLKIPAGQSVAITGPSGSGKTSLISVAAGLERASTGVVSLLGVGLAGKSEDALARLRRGRIGFVFQSFHLLANMTAQENIAAPLEIMGRADALGLAAKILAKVGLEARAAHYPAQLSGGEKQRVAVARALVAQPKIIFADEPTGNLDSRAGGLVADLLFELCADQGTTLVLVTHDGPLAARAARQIIMRDGRLA